MAGFDWPTMMICTGGNILNNLALQWSKSFFHLWMGMGNN
jgi:hypothetical protein